MHVRGFTQDPSSNVAHPGTFLGAIEKIPYLKDLGINAVELLPIYEFNESEVDIKNPKTGERLFNYWGYSTVNFFSPTNRYGVENTSFEFKSFVKECHKNGIEVILDVVYNHTAETGRGGPEYGYRALADKSYYWQTDTGEYFNDTGCGNTFKCTHPVTLDFIIQSLRFWVQNYHIDGFRFDLAPVLYLGSDALIEAITQDPLLANIKMFSEPWDLVHYQVGSFYTKSPRWSEWNGKYRDSVRSFIKGDPNSKGEFAGRLSGSQDLYSWGVPTNSTNFITVHDGFTMNDLVSYNQKNNIANGENNRDGLNENISWNCGVEGPSRNKKIQDLRLKQMKNFFMALFLSRGVPLMLMGDEVAHTKNGNNNTWCQDNKLNWFDWSRVSTNVLLFEFVKKLIKFRKENPEFSEDKFFTPEEIVWHGFEPNNPDWHADDRFVAFTVCDKFYVAFNAKSKAITLELPEGKWALVLATCPEKKNLFENKISMSAYSSLLLKREE
jgi:isoamylase/glycogen operon protein